MTETSLLLFGWVNVGRVVGNSRNYFCNILKISESMKPFARHYVGTLTKLVPRRYYERICFPACFFGKVIVLDVFENFSVIFERSKILSFPGPANVVESERNGRNYMDFSIILISLKSCYSN